MDGSVFTNLVHPVQLCEVVEEGVELVEQLDDLDRCTAGRDLRERHHVAEQNCRQRRTADQ